MKIAVYAIAKNEAKFVERFINSARDADCILIADTGSTDGTPDKARELGATVHEICVSPWRFDVARNAALALVPADIDVCVSIDIDEVLEPGWREEVERVWEPGKTTLLRYVYDWGKGIVFEYEKIHARHGYYWKHPVHEVVVPDQRTKEVKAYTNKLLVRHLPDPSKSRAQYLDLLALSVKEDPNDPRNAFYYARELTYWSRWDEAVVALKRYLSLPAATWSVERAYAMRLLGQAYEHLGQPETALSWYRRACAEAPHVRDPWVDLADACYKLSRWAECFAAAHTALQITTRNMDYTVNPRSWGYLPHDMLALAAYHLNHPAVAIEHGKKALELAPDDDRLKRNLEFYELANKKLLAANFSDMFAA